MLVVAYLALFQRVGEESIGSASGLGQLPELFAKVHSFVLFPEFDILSVLHTVHDEADRDLFRGREKANVSANLRNFTQNTRKLTSSRRISTDTAVHGNCGCAKHVW